MAEVVEKQSQNFTVLDLDAEEIVGFEMARKYSALPIQRARRERCVAERSTHRPRCMVSHGDTP
jgi:hypothetical protein